MTGRPNQEMLADLTEVIRKWRLAGREPVDGVSTLAWALVNLITTAPLEVDRARYAHAAFSTLRDGASADALRRQASAPKQ